MAETVLHKTQGSGERTPSRLIRVGQKFYRTPITAAPERPVDPRLAKLHEALVFVGFGSVTWRTVFSIAEELVEAGLREEAKSVWYASRRTRGRELPEVLQ